MSSNYQAGARFERRVKEDLEGYGYAVIRSAGSHSPADLVATQTHDVVFVQCKRNGRIDPGEWNEFLAFCRKGGATPVIAKAGRNGRGIAYERVTGPKDGTKRRPAMQWNPRQAKVWR